VIGLLFTAALGKGSHHIPCHGRVQNIGRKTGKPVFKAGAAGFPRPLRHIKPLQRPRH
jgi:hypothetical protein